MISHGHVFPRADGTKSDCGGPRHCAMCAAEQNALNTVLENPSAVDLVLRHARVAQRPSDGPRTFDELAKAPSEQLEKLGIETSDIPESFIRRLLAGIKDAIEKAAKPKE